MAPVPIWPPGKRPSVMVRRCVWSRYLPHLLLWRPALQSKEHSCDSSPCLSTNSCLNPTFKYFLPVSMKEAPSIPFELCPEACPVRQLCPVWLLTPPPCAVLRYTWSLSVSLALPLHGHCCISPAEVTAEVPSRCSASKQLTGFHSFLLAVRCFAC